MASLAVLFASTLPSALGHGQMTLPPSRNGGSLAEAGQSDCGTVSSWYTGGINNGTETPNGLVTNCGTRSCSYKKWCEEDPMSKDQGGCAQDCGGSHWHRNFWGTLGGAYGVSILEGVHFLSYQKIKSRT